MMAPGWTPWQGGAGTTLVPVQQPQPAPRGVLGLELTAKVVPYWAAAAGLFHPCIHPSLGVGPTLGEAAFSAEGIPEGADS